MIVAPPKTGKTTILKYSKCYDEKLSKLKIIVLLIDERPEEVTDIRECLNGDNVEVVASTFDEAPENHKRGSRACY